MEGVVIDCQIELRSRRQLLVRAMITGGKPAAVVPAGDAIDSSRMVLAIALIAALDLKRLE